MEYYQTTISLILATICIATLWLKHRYSFWKLRAVENPPHIYLWGNLKEVILQQRSAGEVIFDLYNLFKSKGLRHGGIFSFFWPIYIPVDIGIVKSILQNDFEHFSSRGLYSNEKDDPLSAHLVSLDGEKWKMLRTKLTPAFTAGKCKMMFDTVVRCASGLDEVLKNLSGEALDIHDIASRYTTDIIGNIGFGIECNTLKQPNNDFRLTGDAFFHLTLSENIKIYFAENIPDLMRIFQVRINRPEVSEFFMGLVRKTIDYREKNNISRNDFMHLLIKLKNRGNVEDHGIVNEDNKLTFEEICAQAYIFFLAAYETSATTMSFVMYSLATHQDIQDKVRKEINEILLKHGGRMTYDSLAEMVYLEKVINETMRLFPPLPVFSRVCTKEYLVPGTDLVLKKGQKVYIPVIGIHHDAEFFPDPEKFDPERFFEKNKGMMNPFTFMPFGGGPRICFGMRFGMMQMKAGLVTLITKHKYFLNNKTRIPLKFGTDHPLLTVKGGVWLDFEKIVS